MGNYQVEEFMQIKSPETSSGEKRYQYGVRDPSQARNHVENDPQSQRTIFAPSRPNNRSGEEIAETNADLTHWAKLIGKAY